MSAEPMAPLTVAQWLDQQVEEGVNVSELEIPSQILYDSTADETIFYEEIKSGGILSTKSHPYAMVKRYGNWFVARGQERKAGIQTEGYSWRFNSKNREAAIEKAKQHLAK